MEATQKVKILIYPEVKNKKYMNSNILFCFICVVVILQLQFCVCDEKRNDHVKRTKATIPKTKVVFVFLAFC